MNIRLLYRVFLILFALVLVGVGVLVVFAMAGHVGCTGGDCVPCLSLAKTHEILRQSSGTLCAVLVTLAASILLQLIAGAFFRTQHTSNLVALKMRLNN